MEEQSIAASVATRYQQLETYRSSFIQRAKDGALVTIPSLFPSEQNTSNTTFPTPYQSIGARGLNHLASKLLVALLPPNAPFFRLSLDDATLESLGADELKRGEVEEGLAKIERTVMQEIETLALRVPFFEALKQLILAGNSLIYMPKEGGIRVFTLNKYVVKRDASGNILEIITKESVSPLMLPKAAQELLAEVNDNNKSLDLYTYIKRDSGKWKVLQEIKGQVIPGSEGTYPIDKNPFIPLRFNRIDGEDYGRGFVEEYIGDLESLESLTKAIVEGSAAAAKVLFMVAPNGTTKARTLAQAPNGAIVQGSAQDVSTLRVEKHNDFRVALDTAKGIEERLAYAFMLNTAIQRNGERVTAEEIRYMAQELEGGLGGLYSILSQEFQLPLIHLLLQRLERNKKLPKLPKDTLKPQITTGMEALGRGHDLNKLSQFLQGLQPLGPEVLQQELNVSDYIDRLGASLGLDTKGLIKSDEEKQAITQQAQQAQQAQHEQQRELSATPHVAKEAAGEVRARMNQGR
jgi:hypothetical protein